MSAFLSTVPPPWLSQRQAQQLLRDLAEADIEIYQLKAEVTRLNADLARLAAKLTDGLDAVTALAKLGPPHTDDDVSVS